MKKQRRHLINFSTVMFDVLNLKRLAMRYYRIYVGSKKSSLDFAYVRTRIMIFLIAEGAGRYAAQG